MNKNVQGIENQSGDNEKTGKWNYLKPYSTGCGETQTDKEETFVTNLVATRVVLGWTVWQRTFFTGGLCIFPH